MVLDADFPLYRLVSDKSRDVLVAAEDVRGFFVDQEEDLSEVAFLRVHRLDETMRRVEDAVFEVTNFRQEKIGEYYIGRVVRREVDLKLGAAELSTVSYRFFGGLCEYPRAGEVWRRWASGVVLERDEWLRWPSSDHEAWLHVVQNSWFASRRRAARYGTDEFVYLEGSKVTTKAAFYCALGEAVNGPGGYFGSNLDALADCLSSENGDSTPFKLVWRDFRLSRNSLGYEFIDSLMAIMSEFHIEVIYH
jgi:RNAse (barnase) inhibitor barstar